MEREGLKKAGICTLDRFEKWEGLKRKKYSKFKRLLKWEAYTLILGRSEWSCITSKRPKEKGNLMVTPKLGYPPNLYALLKFRSNY